MDYIVGDITNPGPPNKVILMTSTHPMTDVNLCETGNRIYNLDIKEFPIKWHHNRKVPDNMVVINSIDELPRRPDLILSQNIVDQYNVWVQYARIFDCPLVLFEHTLPTDAWVKQGIPDKLAADLQHLQRVFITDYSRDAWGCLDGDFAENAHTLHHMVNTERFSGWKGGNGRAMIMVNSFAGRKWAVGDVEEIMAIDECENIDLYGANPGYESIALSDDEVVEKLQEYDVFINTSLRSPIPASLLEAASVGTPIVSTATCEIPKFFKDNENIVFYDTMQECVDKTRELLQDEERRKRIGAAGRETVLKHFGKDRYIKAWDSILNTAIDSYNGVGV